MSSTHSRMGQQSTPGDAHIISNTHTSVIVNSTPRKLSSRAKSHGKGLLSRKSSKADSPGQSRPHPRPPSTSEAQDHLVNDKERNGDTFHDPERQAPPIFFAKSVIPDPLGELPAWFSQDTDWASSSAAQFRIKYPIHKPFGPRYYRNRHLSPPSLDKRPPSVFSPAFPPMTAAADRAQDPARMSGPSRTPSGSPLPTPNSSQVRINDDRVRTRKISQTAHDGVDMLDVSDPWGTNWHHQSPYDVGVNHERASPDSPEASQEAPPTAPRTRRTSLTSGRHRTKLPSPLSQSTSAVHLASDPISTHIPRRLSKKRKSFRGLFGSTDDGIVYKSRSAPPTPVDTNSLDRKLSRTGSVIQPSISSSTHSLSQAEKGSKRGSVFGRLAKRFSVLRRSDTLRSTKNVERTRPSVDGNHDLATDTSVQQSRVSPQRPSMRPIQSAEVTRRVPPPAEDSPQARRESVTRDDGSDSGVSIEIPFPAGKLTIANPDEPGDVDISQKDGTPLPALPTQPNVSGINFPSEHTQQRSLESFFNSSQPPIDNSPFFPVHTALSVISEGETYLSTPPALPLPLTDGSPKTPPTIPSLLSLPNRASQSITSQKPVSSAEGSADGSPGSPPTIPSILSLPTRSMPNEPPAPIPSPPLPELPPPTPVVKPEPSLPPTPGEIHPSTPAEPTPIVSNRYIDDNDALSYPISRYHMPYMDNSPLSRASMFVNPPTPQAELLAIPRTQSPGVYIARPQSKDEKPSSHDNTLPKDGSQRVKSRKTETFKLVRTPSGDAQTVSATFVADGEHWGVVESPVDGPSQRKSRKERTKSTEDEKTTRMEGRRGEREGARENSEEQRLHEHRRTSTNGRSNTDPEVSAAAQQATRATITDVPRRSTIPERRRSSRERESYQEAARSTRTPVVTRAPMTRSTSPAENRIERRTSTSASTRPSSEFQSAADLNSMKAKEAWEMERLLKGKSMIYGPDSSSIPGTRPHISSDSRPSTVMSTDLRRTSTIPDIGSTLGPAHGSSHTYFVVQTPYQSVYNTTYSHYQAPPPPAIYASAPSTQYPAPQPARYDYRNHRAQQERIAFPSSSPTSELPTPRKNPLPEPPRLSSYQAQPLPPSLAGTGDGPTSPDYWTKYAGVTTTH